MAAGGRCGGAAGGRSSGQRAPMRSRSTPPVRPPRSGSLICRGGVIAARPAMVRCAHGRLAQLLRARRAVHAMRGVRKVCDERRMAATAVLQRAMAAAVAARRRQHANFARERLHVATRRPYSSGRNQPTSKIKIACLRTRCERAMYVMGPSNPVHYVGTKTPGSPGFS